MASPSFPPPNFDIASITGPMCNTALLGCVAIQVYVYVLAFPRDKIVVKALVSFSSIFFKQALLHTTPGTNTGGWGDPLALLSTPWTLATIPPLTALVSFLVQSFYLWRIWVISSGQKRFIPILAIIGLTATGSCIAGWYAGIALPNAGSGPLAQVNFKRSIKTFDLNPAVTTWLAGAMACDIIITITLVVQLAARRNGALAATKRITHRAIRMAIETGAVTSVAVTIELALILNASTTSWYFMLGLLITKIYSNSLLASLNSRSPIFDSSTTAFWQPSNGTGNNTNVFSTSPPERIVADVELEDTSLGAFKARPGIFTGSQSEAEPV
ncbi:hypothetical protein DFH08DRAFT_938602 [Mycena albidolilacea]|uniref:DUF6534 domain-containing protein n=1 Tax=Mycena albidolilacea TaxID=1033008 RepID=A0AAD6ZW48_9AGAR|nr:hypothetical protein DFH08DRAFT_938602 [Mycena albidolilacea]